jgi:5-methylcytosine-specific restriction enzyme A
VANLAIPKNIKSGHIEQAIQEIDRVGIPEKRESTRFVLKHTDRNYPPKLVISIANKFANGEELSPSEFNGGAESNSFLTGLGFSIFPKEESIESRIRQFHKDMLNIYSEAKKVGYEASRFRTMVANQGGYGVAKKFIHNNSPSEGFVNLWERKRLDLTVEALILKEDYHSLFTEEERSIVRERLQEYGFAMDQGKVNGRNSVFESVIQNDIEAELAEEDFHYKEGTVREYFGKRYERNVENRKRAIEIHGVTCIACGFNFEDAYGERGKDFIEIHHVKPLSTLKKRVIINPEHDLVPLCANCHRMIHRRKDAVLTVQDLKEMIRKSSKEVV